VTIRLIAQRGVFHGKALPVATRGWNLFGSRREKEPRLDAPVDASSELYLEDATAHTKVSLPPPLSGRKYHLFCSEFNAGALALAEELRESDVFLTDGKKASAPLSFTTDVDELDECNHMLVLLDERTWTSGAETAMFVAHIHDAMRTGVHICCVHELPAVVGPHRHACDFALMFKDDWTPAHLTGGPTNLYKAMDIALKGEEWRQPGLSPWWPSSRRALESTSRSKWLCPHRTSRRRAQLHGQRRQVVPRALGCKGCSHNRCPVRCHQRLSHAVSIAYHWVLLLPCWHRHRNLLHNLNHPKRLSSPRPAATFLIAALAALGTCATTCTTLAARPANTRPPNEARVRA